MEWNFRNDLPIYAQLISQMKMAIASGKIRPGDRIPSVRELAIEAKVNPNTMQRALTELEREGFVYAQRTSGRFVTEDKDVISKIKASLAMDQIKIFIDTMDKLGYSREDAISYLTKVMEGKYDNT